jgi:hypothetical protein
MKILVTSVGIYVGRVLKGVSRIKPDRIYLFTSMKEKENDYTKEWSKATTKYARQITDKVSFFYKKSDIKVVQGELGSYSKMLKTMMDLVSKNRGAEFWIDVTSARRGFEMAAIGVGMFFDNVNCFYTPPNKPLMPSDYSNKVIEDEGGEPETLMTPRVDFSELQRGPLREILIVLGSNFKGKSDTFVAILKALDWEETRSNVIRFSKMMKKLEIYGCVKTQRRGREKSVELTPLGESLASVLNS